ncbi:MAG: response regulator [Limisphaerales bacterium]
METETTAGKRILLVEDERVTRELIRELLRQDEHTVVEANNGAEAYALFTKGRYDLVMTDLLMPFVNGEELATRIRQLEPEQPILLITGRDVKCRLGSTVNGILHKPFDYMDLHQEVAKLLS